MLTNTRANLQTRFADAITIWEKILEDNGALCVFETKSQAIHACFRLNSFRLAYRKTLTDAMPMSVYDRFTLSVRGTELVVSPKREIKMVSMTPLEGEAPRVEEKPLGLDEEDC